MNQKDENYIGIGHKVLKEEEKSDKINDYLFIILFYFLGTACFVPSSFYITANGYWMYKFRNLDEVFNDTDTQKTNLQKNFTAYTSVANNVGMIVFLFITIALARFISVVIRILGTMVAMLVLFVLTVFFIFFETDSWQTGFFFIAIGIGGLLNSCAAILIVSVFELASRFPVRCLAAQIAGQAVCGIIAACVQIMSLSVVSSVKSTAGLYFTLAVGVIGGTMIAFVAALYRSEEFQDKLKQKPNETVKAKIKVDVVLLKRLLKKLWLLLTCLILCLVSTHIFYPGLISLMESSGKGMNVWSDTYFVPVCVFLLYYTSDFAGREISNYIAKLRNIQTVVLVSFARLALVPLVILCNIQPRNHLPVVFHNDAFFIVFIFLLSFSSGFVQNVVIIMLPKYCSDEEKAIALYMCMLILLLFGTISSILGSVVVSLI